MKRLVLLIGIACWSAATPAAWAARDVASTRHNLAVSGTGTIRSTGPVGGTQVCAFCHTPHSAAPTTPLWNREDTAVVTYTPYDSSTLAAAPDQPTGKSRLCLSCHDGTVALGALRNPPGRARSDLASVRLGPGQRGFLGTDLSDDHPISFDYNAALYSDPDLEIADPATVDLPLEDIGGERHLQCTTCHDAHNNERGPFLRLGAVSGEICTACHVKRDWWTSSHAISTATPTGPTPWPERRPEWRRATVAENGCMNCHAPHSAATPARLVKQVEEDTCYLCHNGRVAATDIEGDFAKIAGRHPVADPAYAALHDATKAENVLAMPLHVECEDCHNAHRAAPADPMFSSDYTVPHAVAPAANAMIRGVTGLDVNGAPKAEIDFEYELCFKCHGLPGRNTCDGERCGVARTNNMVRVDMLTGDPLFGGIPVARNIRERVYGGTPGLLSWHPIESNNGANDSEVPSLIPGNPLNAAISLIYCTDCHSSDNSVVAGRFGPNGPHGSIWEGLLADRYVLDVFSTARAPADFQLCYNCHDEGTVRSNLSFPEHDSHLGSRRGSCVKCHDPHGSHQSGRLINFLWQSNGQLIVDCLRPDVSPQDPDPCDSAYPVPTWEDRGSFTGACYLNCHGEEHAPETY